MKEIKRFVNLTVGSALSSVLPTVSWIICSIVIDSNMNLTHSIVKPIGYLSTIIYNICGYGAMTYALKEKKEKESENAMLSGIVLSIYVNVIIYMLLFVYVDDYITLAGFDSETFNTYCQFSIITSMFSNIISTIVCYYNFKKQESIGRNITTMYYIITYSSFVCFSILIKDMALSSFCSILCQIIIVVVVATELLKNFKFDLSILKGTKYVSDAVVANVCLTVIMFLGLNRMASASYDATYAYSIFSQSSNWVWAVSAVCIGTVTRLDLIENKFDFKAELKKFIVYAGCVYSIAIVVVVILSIIFKPNIMFVCIYILCDLISLPLYVIKKIVFIYLQTNGFAKDTVISNMFPYVGRALCTLLLPPVYALCIAGLVNDLLGCVCALLYYRKRKKQLVQ